MKLVLEEVKNKFYDNLAKLRYHEGRVGEVVMGLISNEQITSESI